MTAQTVPAEVITAEVTTADVITAEVIVVGAGPVGLMLAGELRLGGVDVVVLEPLAAPTGQSRASHLNARSMEVFDQRGLLPRLDIQGCDSAGHFAGQRLDLGGVASGFAGLWRVPQDRTEAMLQAWAGELGADIRRGHELRTLRPGPDDVAVGVAGPHGPLRMRARYLVGCDGEDSTVRRLAGFAFPGAAATRELLRADVAGVDIADRRLRPYPAGVASAARRGGGVTRVMVHRYHAPPVRRRAAPAFAEVAAAWAEVTGESIAGGTPLWMDAFDDTSRQVSGYRNGRVLVAGDAAHRQLPVGGQAINLGLQDAVNLGWKLAAQVRGWAPDGLLDSYHEERHPVGARVLTGINAQTLLQFGGEDLAPLREFVAELLELPTVRAHLADMISGLDVRYPVGPGGHPLLGARVPPFTLATADEGVIDAAVLLHPARGVLLELSGRCRAPDPTLAGWSGRVRLVTADRPPDGPLAGISSILVRPDGHVVAVDAEPDRLRAALLRWFGPTTTRDRGRRQETT